jgi:hypothetical protein
MQRLVEQPAAEGLVHGDTGLLGRVQYHLAVYQHFSDKEGEPVPLHVEVEGRITPVDALDLIALRQQGLELTLRLADGRRLDFRITHWDGTIHSTGRGLYRVD